MSGFFGEHFYHRITRKMVVAFGTLFNDIQMVRYNKTQTLELERLLVPLMYGQKEKFITRLLQDPTLTRSIQMYLPRMSFALDGLNYDPTRKLVSTQRNITATSNSSSMVYGQYSPAPWDFNFTLSIYARNIEDGLQIIEQILPIFAQDYTLKIVLDSTMGTTYDVPVVLNSVDYTINYEGEGADMRMVMWDLNFTMKGYLLGPTSRSGIIKSANTNFYDASTKGVASSFAGASGVTTGQNVLVLNMQAGGFDTYKDDELIYQRGNSYATAVATGDVLDWDSVNRKLYISNVSGPFIANTTILGNETGAKWNVASFYYTSSPVVRVNVVPNPTTANVSDDFGFTTTITEFPDTL